MACAELEYQRRAYGVMVRLRLAGYTQAEVDTLAEVCLYEGVEQLAAWEKHLASLSRNPRTSDETS